MNFRVTIDIFSGRPNPVLEIKGREATMLYERLRPARRLSGREAALMAPPPLGYRGLIVEQSGAKGLPKTLRVAGGDLFGAKLSHRATDEDLELFLGRNKALLRKLLLGDPFPAYLLKEIDRFRETRERWRHRAPHWPHRERCRCAPLYEPNWWNDAGQKQFNNNCYNQLSHRHICATWARDGRGIQIADLRLGWACRDRRRSDCGSNCE